MVENLAVGVAEPIESVFVRHVVAGAHRGERVPERVEFVSLPIRKAAPLAQPFERQKRSPFIEWTAFGVLFLGLTSKDLLPITRHGSQIWAEFRMQRNLARPLVLRKPTPTAALDVNKTCIAILVVNVLPQQIAYFSEPHAGIRHDGENRFLVRICFLKQQRDLLRREARLLTWRGAWNRDTGQAVFRQEFFAPAPLKNLFHDHESVVDGLGSLAVVRHEFAERLQVARREAHGDVAAELLAPLAENLRDVCVFFGRLERNTLVHDVLEILLREFRDGRFVRRWFFDTGLNSSGDGVRPSDSDLLVRRAERFLAMFALKTIFRRVLPADVNGPIFFLVLPMPNRHFGHRSLHEGTSNQFHGIISLGSGSLTAVVAQGRPVGKDWG